MCINDRIKRAMLAEKTAIELMIEKTHGQYDEVVEAFLGCEGRLVFMGVGKSGHIGKKLAATFSSTGTPAIFVHCTEAAHGDLGMVTDRDIAILISNSGNTSEVVNCLLALKPIGCRTAAFTSGSDSALAIGCELRILLPACHEADSLNLAPTVSSTLTLVLGDAIACALMDMRGFSAKDFYKFHPGGALGVRLGKEGK